MKLIESWNWNDIGVVVCDVMGTICLGLLGVTSIAGTQIQLTPAEALALFCLGKAGSTILSHLQPVGAKRAD